MFDQTKSIIAKSEDVILSHQVNKGVYSWLMKTYRHPLILMFIGSSASGKSFKRLVFSIVYANIFIAILNVVTLPSDVLQYLKWLLCITALSLMFFPTPYQYIFQGIDEFYILSISSIIRKEFNTVNEINLFRENLRRCKEQVKFRVNSFKVVLGTIWALHLFVYTIIEDPISSINNVVTPFSLPEFVVLYLLFLIVFVLLWSISNCYQHGSLIIFDCIEYSCVNVKDEYLKKEEEEQKRFQQDQLQLLREIRDQGRAGSNAELSPVNNLAESLVRTWSKISKKSLIN